MNRKHIVMLAIALACTVSVSTAQDTQVAIGKEQRQMARPDPDKKAREEACRMAAELGLDPQQQTVWESAARERSLANEPLRQQLQGSTTPQQRKEIRSQVGKNNRTFEEKVNASLTDEQRKKYQEWQKEKKVRSHGRKRHAGSK